MFSPDGSSIISASEDGAVRIWDMTDGSSKTLVTRSRFRSEYTSVAISPNGRLIAAGDISGVRRFLVVRGVFHEHSFHRPYLSSTLTQANCWKICRIQKVEFAVLRSPQMDEGWCVAVVIRSNTGTSRVWRMGQMATQTLRVCQDATL